MRCPHCENVTIQTIREISLPLQPSLKALRDSAKAGCDFCSLVWTSLDESNAKTDIEAHLHAEDAETAEDSGAAVVIAAQLDDHAKSDSDALSEPQIYISCGGLNINDSRGKPYISGFLSVYAHPGKAHLIDDT